MSYVKIVPTDLPEPVWIEYDEGVSFLVNWLTPLDEQKYAHDYVAGFNHIVKDWNGVLGADDKPLECNEQMRKAFISTSTGKDIFQWIVMRARDMMTFTKPEQLIKNLNRPLVSRSTTQRPPANGAASA